jgi:hypothetical protein
MALTKPADGAVAVEQCRPASVAPREQSAGDPMTQNQKTYALRIDLLLAAVMVVAGLAVSGISLSRLANTDLQVAQATPRLQSTPGAESKPSAPAEPTTRGMRPTEIAPQPAQPDTDARKAGATPALPPAPAEKTAEPIKQR